MQWRLAVADDATDHDEDHSDDLEMIAVIRTWSLLFLPLSTSALLWAPAGSVHTAGEAPPSALEVFTVINTPHTLLA